MAMTKPDPGFRGLGAVLLGAVMIGTAAIFMRLADVAPSASAFWRLTLASPILVLWYCWRTIKAGASPLAVPPDSLRWILLVGFLFALELYIWHWSVAYTTVANATLLANMATIFAALYGFLFFGARFNRRFMLGMALALVGAILLIGQSAEINRSYIRGDMLGLLTATLYAAYIIGAARARAHVETPLLMAGTALVSGFFLGIPLLWETGAILPQSPEGWLPLAGLALIAHVLGQGMIVHGLAHVQPALGALGLLIQPIVSAILAWWIFGESLGPLHMLGGGAILFGIWMARQSGKP